MRDDLAGALAVAELALKALGVLPQAVLLRDHLGLTLFEHFLLGGDSGSFLGEVALEGGDPLLARGDAPLLLAVDVLALAERAVASILPGLDLGLLACERRFPAGELRL